MFFSFSQNWIVKKKNHENKNTHKCSLASAQLYIGNKLRICTLQIANSACVLKARVLCVALCVPLGSSAPVSYCTCLEFFCILYRFKDRNINISTFPEMPVCAHVCASLKLPRLQCCFLLPDTPVGLPEQQALFQ